MTLLEHWAAMPTSVAEVVVFHLLVRLFVRQVLQLVLAETTVD